MLYVELDQENSFVNTIDLPFFPDTERLNLVVFQPGAIPGDYYDGEKFIAVRNFPGSISKTTVSANAIDSIEISMLPIPWTITIDSETYEVTDGVFEFTVDTPGTYIIKAECFPYQPKEWEVTAE